jgi:glycerol-3-phosphate dehydrogenase
MSAAAAEWDVVVVGGGIHGAGVAQAAAAAGQRTLLLEEREPAFGTSSRSSKLIHGGLRYLETAQLGLVRESLAERAILLRIAPRLVRLVPFHIPIYRETVRKGWQIRAGLSLYWALGGFARACRFASVPRREWDGLDGLATTGLRAVFRYGDGQTDDDALVRAVLRSAASLGASLRWPARFLSAARVDGGYRVRFAEAGGETECATSALVLAAGPWIDEAQSRVTPPVERPPVELVQGAHILLEGELRSGIYYCEAPSDKRAVFVMPWKGATLVGTTETVFRGRPEEVAPLPEEIAYLRRTFANYFPRRSLDVRGAIAGLRVLPRGPGPAFRRAREVTLAVDDARAPHLVAIYGGKLTGYRSTAEKVLARLRHALAPRPPLARTEELPLEPA